MMNDENVYNMYLKEVSAIPLLTREQEIELATQAKQGNKAAKEKLINANLRFVIKIAVSYQNHGMDLVDLISEGNIGLITAVDKFDVSKGYHFISYAVWWIRQAILKAIYQKSRAIRLPMNKVNQLVTIEKARHSIKKTGNEEQDIVMMGDMLGMDADDIRQLLDISREMVSLDSFIGNDDGATFGQMLPDTVYASPEEAAMETLLKDDISKALSKLKPNEAKVLTLRYGLGGHKVMSLKEIGEICNLSKERIRQIESKALQQLKRPSQRVLLEDYVA